MNATSASTTTATTASPTGSITIAATRQKLQTAPLNRTKCLSLIEQAQFTNDKEIANAVAIAKWFYQSSRKLEVSVLHDVAIWKEVLKLGFNLAGKGRPNDLHLLLAKFTKLFPFKTLTDQEAVELLIKAYGIIGRPQSIAAVLAGVQQTVDRRRLEAAAVLAYADCGANEQVDALLGSSKNILEANDYRRLARIYAYKGNVERTKAAMQHYDNDGKDQLMLLRAHGRALDAICRYRVQHRGVFGLTLNSCSIASTAFDKIDQSFEAAEVMQLLEKPDSNVSEWNLVLDYYCRANQLDHTRYPMARAEGILKGMSAKGIQPNEMTYHILLNAYSRCQEYNDTNNTNTRLDKALALFEEFSATDATDYRRMFHALLRACIPHGPEHYPYDYFTQASNIEAGTPRMHLDHRFFDIEKIMLKGRVPYDRLSFATALTCLGAARQYKAMWERWQMTKLSGLRRSQSLYRHVFALASLDPEQAGYALSVVKEELVREIPNVESYHPELLTAMLDCCVAAKEPRVAKQIIHGSTMLSSSSLSSSPGNHRPILAVLRAATSLQGLEAEAKAVFDAVPKDDLPFNSRLWYWSMVYLALQGGNAGQAREIQSLFTSYTMKRFESLGKVAIPVHETSPVVPFPSGPYTSLDMSLIDMYIQSLVDSQNVSLVVDVLKEWNSQKSKGQRLSKAARQGVLQLLEREKSGEDLDWVKQNII
ncbi:hypothetical protein BX666DRAFT_1877419 [Dichotomocladium elegans]|nr:hypothetical protein BX666DRAFT_1877419 [Dichotomocladium elegans]